MDTILLYLHDQAIQGPFDLHLYNQLMAVLKKQHDYLANEMEKMQQISCHERMAGKSWLGGGGVDGYWSDAVETFICVV